MTGGFIKNGGAVANFLRLSVCRSYFLIVTQLYNDSERLFAAGQSGSCCNWRCRLTELIYVVLASIQLAMSRDTTEIIVRHKDLKRACREQMSGQLEVVGTKLFVLSFSVAQCSMTRL